MSVSISIPTFIGGQVDFFSPKGVEIHIACSASKELREFCTNNKTPFLETKINRRFSIFDDLKSVFKLYKYIKHHKIDIVVGHSPKGALLAMISAYCAKVKSRIYFRHGLVLETATGVKKKVLTLAEKITSYLATRIVNVSNSLMEKSIRMKFGNKVKNILIGKGSCSGIDTKRFSPPTEKDLIKKNLHIDLGLDFIVIFVGRLSGDKGVELLVEAWGRFITSFPNSKLILIGSNDERDGLSTIFLNKINSEKSILQIPNTNKVQYYYQISDVAVLPSYREGLPTCNLEASASGITVLTSKSTGCIDSIINKETGIFVELDSEDILEKLSFLRRNPQILLQYGKNGRSFIEKNYSREVVLKRLYDFYFTLHMEHNN